MESTKESPATVSWDQILQDQDGNRYDLVAGGFVRYFDLPPPALEVQISEDDESDRDSVVTVVTTRDTTASNLQQRLERVRLASQDPVDAQVEGAESLERQAARAMPGAEKRPPRTPRIPGAETPGSSSMPPRDPTPATDRQPQPNQSGPAASPPKLPQQHQERRPLRPLGSEEVLKRFQDSVKKIRVAKATYEAAVANAVLEYAEVERRFGPAVRTEEVGYVQELLDLRTVQQLSRRALRNIQESRENTERMRQAAKEQADKLAEVREAKARIEARKAELEVATQERMERLAEVRRQKDLVEQEEKVLAAKEKRLAIAAGVRNRDAIFAEERRDRHERRVTNPHPGQRTGARRCRTCGMFEVEKDEDCPNADYHYVIKPKPKARDLYKRR